MDMDSINLNAVCSLLEKAQISCEASQYTDAANSYCHAANLCESAAIQYRSAEARALISADKLQDALTVAEKVLKIQAKNSAAWYLKASALFKMEKRNDAKSAFLKAAGFETDLILKTSYEDWAARCDQTDFGVSDSNKELSDPAAIFATTSKDSASISKLATRMTWYQSATHVNVDIYAKNVIREESKVEIGLNTLSIQLKQPDNGNYTLEINLFDTIDPSDSSWNASPVKVEVRLKKVEKGVTWKALDSSAMVASAAVEAGASSKKRMNERTARQKEWDSIAEKELKDYTEEDSSMALFRTIYKDADDDTRRAMLKSYTESGGQVLSTNWDEVKKKKVIYEGSD